MGRTICGLIGDITHGGCKGNVYQSAYGRYLNHPCQSGTGTGNQTEPAAGPCNQAARQAYHYYDQIQPEQSFEETHIMILEDPRSA